MKTVYVSAPGSGEWIPVELFPDATFSDFADQLGVSRGRIQRQGALLASELDDCLHDVLQDGERLLVAPLEGRVTAKLIPSRVTCARIAGEAGYAEDVWDRQAKVPGFNQQAFSRLRVLLAGAGALGGEVAEGLTRKGVGSLTVLDFDVVQPSNLARQFFGSNDIYKNKALCLVRNLEPHGWMGSELVGWPVSFEEAVELPLDLHCDVIACAVDDASSRVAISRFATQEGIPAVFAAVSAHADHGVVFVQQPAAACFGCAFPEQIAGKRTPCPGSPAIKDIMKTIGGVVLYAIDTLFMDRPRRWNLYDLSLTDGEANRYGTVERQPDCPLCGGGDT